jgi:hypothetical protein
MHTPRRTHPRLAKARTDSNNTGNVDSWTQAPTQNSVRRTAQRSAASGARANRQEVPTKRAARRLQRVVRRRVAGMPTKALFTRGRHHQEWIRRIQLVTGTTCPAMAGMP